MALAATAALAAAVQALILLLALLGQQIRVAVAVVAQKVNMAVTVVLVLSSSAMQILTPPLRLQQDRPQLLYPVDIGHISGPLRVQ